MKIVRLTIVAVLVGAGMYVLAGMYERNRTVVNKTAVADRSKKGNQSPANNITVTPSLAEKAAEAKVFVSEGGYNDTRCFLIDMSRHSGSRRFFVYNLKKDSIEKAGLVTHGSGRGSHEDGKPRFSNTPNSLCTALGKYKIGYSYSGQFGLAFKLYGLETTNNKAFERAIVLHGHECVPDWETNGGICESWGCPTVSPAFLLELKPLITASKKPLLLWIFE